MKRSGEIRPPSSLNVVELREWYRVNLGWIPRNYKQYPSIQELEKEQIKLRKEMNNE